MKNKKKKRNNSTARIRRIIGRMRVIIINRMSIISRIGRILRR